jgi:hypothetical protein
VLVAVKKSCPVRNTIVSIRSRCMTCLLLPTHVPSFPGSALRKAG